MVVPPASSPSPCSLGLQGCSASAPCRAWHARAARRVPPAPGPAETCGRPGRSQPAPRRILPSAAPTAAASPAAAAGAEATPPFRPPRGRGRRRALPGLSLAPAAPPPRPARPPPPPPGRPPGSSPRPGAAGTGNRKCAASGGAATCRGPELSATPVEDAPEPVSGLHPIPHLLRRRRDHQRPTLPRAGVRLALKSLSALLSVPITPGISVPFPQFPFSSESPCPLPPILPTVPPGSLLPSLPL